jgi:hypothetical protein
MPAAALVAVALAEMQEAALAEPQEVVLAAALAELQEVVIPAAALAELQEVVLPAAALAELQGVVLPAAALVELQEVVMPAAQLRAVAAILVLVAAVPALEQAPAVDSAIMSAAHRRRARWRNRQSKRILQQQAKPKDAAGLAQTIPLPPRATAGRFSATLAR